MDDDAERGDRERPPAEDEQQEPLEGRGGPDDQPVETGGDGYQTEPPTLRGG